MTDWHAVVPFIKAAIYERPPRAVPAAGFMERGPPACSNYQLPPNVRALGGEGSDRTSPLVARRRLGLFSLVPAAD